MLDDLDVLRDAVAAYRAAATAAGVTWPDQPGRTDGQPPELVYRLFGVDHIAEQLIWLESQGWHAQPLLPQGGGLMPWSTDADEALDNLSFAIATPFPWRQQMPLFFFGRILYTFVLKGDHEGEVWRSEADPDAWDSVRAATSLAALFTQWTRGIEAGVVSYGPQVSWLQVGDDVHDPFDVLQERAAHLDPFAFPVSSIAQQPLLRARQRECGVDMTCIERGFDCQEELLAAIDAVRASLNS
ncbi:hypothetical protein GCM10023322_07470 [Rugosimonospora acidiphila]|uniref:Uncharacterized protein n=1 Tax=Rugosimonospora acidiphila TaxID=556531 RepID=A0ABP9RKC6_9ACTN